MISKIPELTIIPLLIKNKNLYKENISYIKISKDNKELINIYSVIAILMDSVDSASIDDLESLFFSNYPQLKPDQITTYTHIFNVIREQDVSEAILSTLISDIRVRYKAQEIGLTAFDVSEGKKPSEALSKLLSSFNEVSEPIAAASSDDIYSSSFVDILQERHEHPGIRFRLESLHRMLGPLRQGNFGKIFARPETGKTTFLASEVTYLAEQLTTENPCLWFNNEEEKSKVWLRIMQGALGLRKAEFTANPEHYDEMFQAILGGKLLLVDDGALSKAKVERICAQYNPGLIVFDQIGKITGFDADREDLHQGAIYQWGRSLAKQYGPVIAVGQADGTAEGVKWLTMSHIANAKTAIQAEVDFIIGIGKSHNEEEKYIRYLNISKNKLDPENENERHGKRAVIIEPEVARYKDI